MTQTVLLGTTKGAFLLQKDAGGWQVSGPHCDGWSINHVIGEPNGDRLWAGGGSTWSGAGVWRSEDGGKSWEVQKLSRGEIDAWAEKDPEMAKMLNWSPQETAFDGEVEAVWSLHLAGGRLYAGVKPGNLLHSEDGGITWQRNAALAEFEGRAEWNAGAAGLVLHTIVSDPENPQKLWLGISAAGVFATEDGGATWERRNRLGNASACPHFRHTPDQCTGEVGHCVHNMMRANGAGDLIYQQNHHGVWRSSDGGRNWQNVTDGLPSNFGFPIAVHPSDPKTLWVLPLNGDTQGRFPPGASAAVWKSADGGQTWKARQEGLPTENCYFTVLRQAMAVGGTETAELFFGSNSGSVFASFDEGESWQEIARHLPTILSVEVA